MFEEKIYISKNIKSGYLRYLKYNINSGCEIPIIIYLHGAGSRGESLKNLNINVGPLSEIQKGRKIPAVVVAPQCHGDSWFDLFNVLAEFIENIIKENNIDKNRVYLCGVSMGAYAAWQMAMSHPDLFAALIPVCGGGMYWNAQRLKNLPIWAFHGECDNVVLCDESIKMVKAVNASGGNAKITLYPNIQHNSWEKAFANDDMWKWMFSQRKTANLINEKTNIKTGD